MKQDQIDSISRREALRQGLGAVAGVAIVGFAGSKTWAAEKKIAKSAVNYVDTGKDEGKDCDDCMHFMPGKTAKASGTCKIVEGAINPHGHCNAFAAKPAK